MPNRRAFLQRTLAAGLTPLLPVSLTLPTAAASHSGPVGPAGPQPADFDAFRAERKQLMGVWQLRFELAWPDLDARTPPFAEGRIYYAMQPLVKQCFAEWRSLYERHPAHCPPQTPNPRAARWRDVDPDCELITAGPYVWDRMFSRSILAPLAAKDLTCGCAGLAYALLHYEPPHYLLDPAQLNVFTRSGCAIWGQLWLRRLPVVVITFDKPLPVTFA